MAKREHPLDKAGNVYYTRGHSTRAVREAMGVYRYGIDGITTKITGGQHDKGGNGSLATEANVNRPSKLTFDKNGNLYIARDNHPYDVYDIKRVGTDGIISAPLSTGGKPFAYTGAMSADVSFRARTVAFGPDNKMYVASKNHTVFSIGSDDKGYQFTDQLSTISEDGNLKYTFTSSGRHLKTQDTLTNNTLYQFRYNDNGQLVEIEDLDGDVTIIERASDGTPLGIVSADGHRTQFSLDSKGYLSRVADPAGHTWLMTYSEKGLMQSFSDPNDNLTQFTFETDGRLKTDINPVGGGWTLEKTEVDSSSYKVKMTSAEQYIQEFLTELRYDQSRLMTTLYADGTKAQRHIYNNGRITTTTPDGTQVTVTQQPDPRFSLISPIPDTATVKLPSGLTSTANYDKTTNLAVAGNLSSLTSQTETYTTNGRVAKRVYQANTKTFTDTSAENRTNTTTLDSKGRIQRVTVNGLAPVDYSYDSRGRLQTATSNNGLTTRTARYDYYNTDTQAGFLASITDAIGQQTRFEYDAVGRITKETLFDGRSIHYSYDANGNLTSLTPPGRSSHRFDYTAGDQTDQYTPPSLVGINTPTRYRYNRDKQLLSISRPDGLAIDFNYHPLNGKLDSFDIPQGRYQFNYDDATGQLQQLVSPDNRQLDYRYDGSLVTQTTWTGETSGSYGISANNNFWVTADHVNGDTITYRYDNDGLLVQAGDLQMNREAQKGGLPSNTSLGLLTTTHHYNNYAELDDYQVLFNDSPQLGFHFTHDSLGRMTTQTETSAGISQTLEYSYDTTGRLQNVKRNGLVTEQYGYDNNSNRTHLNGTLIATYDDQDRLLTYQGNSYRYTDNGELKSKTQGGAVTSYNYDVLGNLTQVTLPGDITIDYLMDGQNRRIGKKVNGELKQGFLYQDQLNPIAELNANNEVISRFVYADKANVPAYMVKIDPSTQQEFTYRIISDHLGSPRMVINTLDGTIVQRIDYDIWGTITQDTNPGFQPFGFVGGLYDQHTGLVRFGARDYDSQTGRWTTKDPILFAGGDTNLYGYVVNDPVNLIDPDGLEVCTGYGQNIICAEGQFSPIPGTPMTGPLSPLGIAKTVASYVASICPIGRIGGVSKSTNDILVLGRQSGLTMLAKKEGGRLSTTTSNFPKVIYKQNSSDIRKADKVIFYQKDVPNSLKEALEIKGGQYARAERELILSSPDLLKKAVFK